MKYWFRKGKGRLYVLNFLILKKNESLKQYHDHLGSEKAKFDMEIHLSGQVMQATKLQRFDDLQEHDLDPMDISMIMSLPSEKEYGAYLGSDGHKKIEEYVKESTILTQQLTLPPKEQAINKYDWTYGNPYEPYGEDWFG